MRVRWSSRSTRWRFAVGCALLAAVAATATVAFAVTHRPDGGGAEICTLVGYGRGCGFHYHADGRVMGSRIVGH